MLQFLLTITDEAHHSRIEYIYNHFHDDMMRFAVSRFKIMNSYNPFLDAEDAVQRAFLRITKYIDKFEFQIQDEKLRTYLFSIVSNEITRMYKENTQNFEFREENFKDNGYNIIEDVDIRLRYEEVVRAIENLDPIYSITLLLVYESGMTINEISEMMQISTKTVYTRLTRGKKLLRDALKGE